MDYSKIMPKPNRKISLELTGLIPSKKNSRINTRSGRSFPSKKYAQWRTEAMLQISQQARGFQTITEPVAIHFTLFFDTKRRADLDNKIASIFDMLVDYGILADDSWQVVPTFSVQAVYRKGKAGAVVDIFDFVV